MNYLILAARAIGEILEENPNLNKSSRAKKIGKGIIHYLHPMKHEQKKKNWLSKYKF